MQSEYFQYALLAALAIALLVAAVTDLRRREIDNWLNIAIALGAPLFWLASGFGMLEIGFQLGIAVLTFVVMLVLFATGQMGGGDVKLLTALALWITPVWFLRLLIVMAIVGGLLTIVLYVRHRIRRDGSKIAVPYGVAISVAGLWIIGSHYVPVLLNAGISG
ncbi:peptidase [Novosphingobium marinum]|uniref:Prepilin peptidase CpaA n=1 Tax=Novosphingobium marinum TaxID=1514948 RepID=A0A7Z0BTX1_9SPHN|nr:prepilin peptidase [Novosphingobium marinum]NYH96471.1 prepilin peptidase CpaA [Novosphingobium marinum]GGC35484.1 peptidase [Novosphingobium marinum]